MSMIALAALALCATASLVSSQIDRNATAYGVGDIIESSGSTGRFARQAMVNRAWPNSIIPIFFAPGYPESQKPHVIRGLKIWEKKTCVRFRQDDTTTRMRVKVVNGAYCQSSVGREGGEVQTISLGGDCMSDKTTAHELGHTIGLQHTVTRVDREQYVTVDRSNIHSSQYDLNLAVISSSQQLVPYDIMSIMHYPTTPNGMTIDKQRPAITVRSNELADYKESMGNFELSFYDIMMVNKMYKCAAKCASSSTRCANNGVPDVNDCSRCICPVAWGGATCNENPTGSTVLTAAYSGASEVATVGRHGDGNRGIFTVKPYVITAPAGKRIELKIAYMYTGDADNACIFGGLEVNTKANSRISGPHVCVNYNTKTYVSETNRMVFRIFGQYEETRADFTYRAIVRGEAV